MPKGSSETAQHLLAFRHCASAIFTTKNTKSTKLEIQKYQFSESFVSFVRFVVN